MPDGNEYDVEFRGITKRFGDVAAVNNVSLQVHKGEFLSLLGPSGCGKTTLLRLIAGFDAADSGTIAVDERVVDAPGVHVPPEKRRIGYVPQEGTLFPHLSVADNVAFGLPRAERGSARVAEVTAKFNA